jgi:alpha-amylase/alpha-mannosidase (GH57 family)
MKYIITEEQNERLMKIIMKFFDNNLTPVEGWDPHEYYESDKETDGEVFIRLTDDEWGMNRNNHMYYTTCDNPQLDEPLPEGECPKVSIPRSIYETLNQDFGDAWKKLFRRWFILHTGLLVVEIDSL